MSIPPLVCSTPPPPEQIDCDERFHDDFAIAYDLSQDDEDFSSEVDIHSALPTNSDCNTFLHNTSPSNADIRPSDIIFNEKSDNTSNSECNNRCGKLSLDGKIIDEDNNIEDLGLKYELTEKQNLDTSSKTYVKKEEEPPEENTNDLFSINSIEIKLQNENNETPNQLPKTHAEDVLCDINPTDLKNDTLLTPIVLENVSNEEIMFNEIEQSINKSTENIEIESENDDFNDFNLEKDIFSTPDSHQGAINNDLKIDSIHDDNDDFNTFHFTNFDKDSLSPNIDKCLVQHVDPWSSDVNPSQEFGDFQATFDDKFQQNDSEQTHEIQKQFEVSETVDDQGDEDFGEFDDFQSSACPSKIGNESDTATQFILKIPENQNQLYERIEKIVNSMFEEEIPDEQNSVPYNLESLLSVTWGHLTETEVRQPYMLNWNNSISQKSLLKSLNIDSRNILFGPKWSNTPRYAANLGSSPLQPVKQTTSSSALESTTQRSEDKSKQPETWAEAANEGQEFTYAEALLLDLEHLLTTLDRMSHQQSSLKISELLSHACNDSQNKVETEPEQRTVLTEEILKPNKPLSSTLTLQPIRQISLPDTHIFTPTDSEIPRSQTIHYNIDSFSKLTSDNGGGIQNEDKTEKLETKDDEFDDFQDFKASTVKPVTGENQKTAEKGLTPFFQTQSILEPIKLEPIMPTLNWPEPGEVKEVFDDFTDFASNSTLSSLNSDDKDVKIDELAIKNYVFTRTPPTNIQVEKQHVENEKETEDEFENFQFAPLPVQVSQLPTVPQLQPQNTNTEPSPSVNTFVINGLLHPMKPLQLQSTSIPANKAMSISAQILKPGALDKGSQEKSGSQQILQPLSLESISQINWPNPGVDLQNLSCFNPVNALHSLNNSPAKQVSSHASKNQDDDGWGDFVSIKPSISTSFTSKHAEDNDWGDFVSNSSPNIHNGVNTISFNVQTNLTKSSPLTTNLRQDDARVSIPTLNYVTPNSNQRFVKDSQFQNL